MKNKLIGGLFFAGVVAFAIYDFTKIEDSKVASSKQQIEDRINNCVGDHFKDTMAVSPETARSVCTCLITKIDEEFTKNKSLDEVGANDKIIHDCYRDVVEGMLEESSKQSN